MYLNMQEHTKHTHVKDYTHVPARTGTHTYSSEMSPADPRMHFSGLHAYCVCEVDSEEQENMGDTGPGCFLGCSWSFVA